MAKAIWERLHVFGDFHPQESQWKRQRDNERRRERYSANESERERGTVRTVMG